MAGLCGEYLYALIVKVKGFKTPIYHRNYDWNEKDVN